MQVCHPERTSEGSAANGTNREIIIDTPSLMLAQFV